MNRQLIILLLCLTFCQVSLSQDGPSNADHYISYIRTNGFSYGYDHTPDNSANRAFFLLEAQADNGGATTCLFDTISGAGYDVGTVYTAAQGPPFENFSSGTVKEIIHADANSTNMNITMMSWGHQCGSLIDYHHDPSCDHNKEATCTIIDTREGAQGVFHQDWYATGDNSKIRIQKTWKPKYGENFEASANSVGPLTFGTIGPDEYRTHENGIRRRPSGAPLNLGYQNWWYNGMMTAHHDDQLRSSPDVTYSFTMQQTGTAIISLDFPETNFDTRLHVFTKGTAHDGRGNIYGYRINLNNDNKKSVMHRQPNPLPAGEYYVVIEGNSNIASDWGDYKLTIATPTIYNAGTIVHPHNLIPEGCVLQSPIVSGDAPASSIGNLEFQWEYNLVSGTGWNEIPGATSETLSGNELGPIDAPTRVRRRFRTLGGAAYSNTLIFDILEKGESGHNGAINGKVTGPEGAGVVAGVSIIVEAISAGDQLCKADTFTTLSTGTYTATNLYYGDDAVTHRITPQFEDHEFDPPYREAPINSNTTIPDQNFSDTTTVFVSGFVFQKDVNGDSCALPGVILKKDDFPVSGAVTLADGTYSIPTSTGEFEFSADFMDGAHTFSPASYAGVDIFSDTSGFNYESITTHTVSGSVTACGGFCFGGVEIRLIDDYACFDYLIETDSCGVFSTTVPARNYRLEITNTDVGLIAGYDGVTIADFFANKDTLFADLSKADTVFHLVYERTPIITLRTHTDSTGIQPIANCTQDTVLAQGELTTLVFDITESNTEGCPLDTGIMVLIDEISGRDTVYVPISDGIAMYDVIPDTPYLFPSEPYQYLEYYAMNQDSQLVSASNTIRAIVTGVKARNASFTTVSPEIPFLILRDPPGDESYAYFEESHTTDFNLSFSAEYGGSVTTWGKLKTGAKFEAGFLGFSTESEAWGEVGASATVSASNRTDTNLTVSVTNSVSHATEQSQNPNLIGAGGDLFVGGAMNLIFAKADVLQFDEETCRDTQVVDLIMGQDSFRTQFIYTDFYIRTVEIPKIEDLRDLGPPDSAWYYQGQIDMWEQTLARNEDLKQMAVPSESYPTNISFSGGSTTEYTTINSSTTSISYEFSIEVDAEISAEAGFEVAGSGASGGVRSNFRVEIGGSESSKDLRSRTTKFILSDSEDQDAYTVDIRECPVYNTPVFNIVAGTTSCPYAPSTVNRDLPLLLIDNPVRVDADPNGTETFILEIYNLSENDIESSRNFVVDFIDVTNANNAAMNPDLRGSNKLIVNVPYNPPSSSPQTIQIDVSNNNGAFDYENLTFVVYPECDDISDYNPATSSQASISIFYESPCSDIAMSSPTSDYTVNSDDNDMLAIRMSDYTVAQLDQVEVQYTQSGGANWTTGLIVPAAQLDPVTTDVNLDVSSLLDGLYDIRLKLNCAGGASFTQRESSLIDRIAPIVFGIPQPIDDDYDQSANDEISVSFEEDIVCTNATVLLTDMETLVVLPATLGCSGNKAVIVSDIVLDSLGPSIYRVTLSGVEDLYGNVREDYRWVFIVGDYIYDPDCSPVNISNNNVDQNAISQSVYRATEITSDGTVGTATQVGYVAQESVSLQSGFTVNEDGSLEVNIENCND